MLEIFLTQGKVALVSDARYDELNAFNWHAVKYRNTFYAARNIVIDGKQFKVLMHRQVLDLGRGDGKKVDHRDHNGCNNQEENLRVATASQNAHNQLPWSKAKTSRFKNVRWDKTNNRWKVSVMSDGVSYNAWSGNEVSAAHIADKLLKLHHGDFAVLNFRADGF